jgi:hypothetical protein
MYLGYLTNEEKVELASQPAFKLNLKGKPTAEGIQSIIDYIKEMHLVLGGTKKEITEEYMHGACGFLSNAIYQAYGKHEDIQVVFLRDIYDGVQNNHAAIKLRNQDAFFDIKGQQTLAAMKSSLQDEWKISQDVAAHLTAGAQCDKPMLELFNRYQLKPELVGQSSELIEFCLKNIKYIPEKMSEKDEVVL